MKNQSNSQSVPYNFAHCFNQECVMRGQCLRHLAALNCTKENVFLQIINPAFIPEDTSKCDYFFPIRKIQIAWGIKHILDKVAYKEAKYMKAEMIDYFGKTVYYRYCRKEAGLSVGKQKFIIQLFKNIILRKNLLLNTIQKSIYGSETFGLLPLVQIVSRPGK